MLFKSNAVNIFVFRTYIVLNIILEYQFSNKTHQIQIRVCSLHNLNEFFYFEAHNHVKDMKLFFW
jgi:hypothetical protein